MTAWELQKAESEKHTAVELVNQLASALKNAERLAEIANRRYNDAIRELQEAALAEAVKP